MKIYSNKLWKIFFINGLEGKILSIIYIKTFIKSREGNIRVSFIKLKFFFSIFTLNIFYFVYVKVLFYGNISIFYTITNNDRYRNYYNIIFSIKKIHIYKYKNLNYFII